jgi:hypothetical protein
MSLNDNDPGGNQDRPQAAAADYRIWTYTARMDRVQSGRKRVTLEACLIGFIMIAVWVNAGIIVLRDSSVDLVPSFVD